MEREKKEREERERNEGKRKEGQEGKRRKERQVWREKKRGEKNRDFESYNEPSKSFTSSPTTNTLPLDLSHVNNLQNKGPVRAGLVGAASSGFTGLLIADSFLCKGRNHGRKQPLSLFFSKIFIHSSVASKHNWCNLDEILIIRDFNDLSCCGWTGEANKEAAKVHPSTAGCFPSAL